MNVHGNVYMCLADHGWDILILLRDRPLFFSQLVEKTGVHRGTVSRNLRSLKQYGLIRPSISRINGMIQGYELTENGTKLLDTAERELMMVEYS